MMIEPMCVISLIANFILLLVIIELKVKSDDLKYKIFQLENAIHTLQTMIKIISKREKSE